MYARPWLSSALLLVTLAALVACEDGTSPPASNGSPRPADVLLETTGSLEAESYPGDVDSFSVFLSERRAIGVILDASGPIGVVHGPTREDVTYSFDGSPVTAIAAHTQVDSVRIQVRHIVPQFDATTYELRIVAVDTMPEHADGSIAPDAAFHRDWIDPPLDLDVYTVDFTGVDSYFVELESADENVGLSARILTPGGLTHFVILETGAGIARSVVYSVDEPGDHELLIHATGLAADVETSYRFRVVDATPVAQQH